VTYRLLHFLPQTLVVLQSSFWNLLSVVDFLSCSALCACFENQTPHHRLWWTVSTQPRLCHWIEWVCVKGQNRKIRNLNSRYLNAMCDSWATLSFLSIVTKSRSFFVIAELLLCLPYKLDCSEWCQTCAGHLPELCTHTAWPDPAQANFLLKLQVRPLVTCQPLVRPSRQFVQILLQVYTDWLYQLDIQSITIFQDQEFQPDLECINILWSWLDGYQSRQALGLMGTWMSHWSDWGQTVWLIQYWSQLVLYRNACSYLDCDRSDWC